MIIRKIPNKINTYLDILDRSADHQELFSKINTLNKIQQLFVSIAPHNLAKQCQLSLPVNGKLTVFAENGSIAAKLKQILPSILYKIQHQGWEVTSIKIAIQSHRYTQTKDKSTKEKRQIGKHGVESFAQLAACLPSSILKTAINSLIKNK